MIVTPILLQLSMLAGAYATPAYYKHLTRDTTGSIQWGRPCVLNATFPMECGSLTVPLDYHNASAGTIELELLRMRASKTPFKGSILFAFGGPGPNGREDFLAFSPQNHVITGGHYDLIMHVQRGSAYSTPIPFHCYSQEPGAPTAPLQTSANRSDAAAAEMWANAEIIANDCYTANNKTGRFTGSAYSARDLLSVVDALGEDGLLRYWGFSAGTTLGNYFVSMFPERVDKMVLDGVVNPYEYIHNKEVEMYTDGEKAFSGFIEECVKNPTRCALAHNRTAEQIEEAIMNLLDDLKASPMPLSIPGVLGGTVLDDFKVKQAIFQRLYFPALWFRLATNLEALISGNMTGIIEAWYEDQPARTTEPNSEAVYGIKCGDMLSRQSTLEELRPVIEGRLEKFRFADAADAAPFNCARWKFEGAEKTSGNFSARTTTPVLLIGNTGDPVTPILSARNVSAGLEGSVVLEHGSYGHCSHVTQASLCTAKAVRAYFNDGTLPEPGTVCEVDAPYFERTTGWETVMVQLESE